MNEERRYRDDEVAEIFEAAAADPPPRRALSSVAGFTLAELQAIGAEAGLSPERIAMAASGLDRRRDSPPRTTHLGMPISVGRTVALPRAPTDHEWAVLVAELREIFQAQGKDQSHGAVRYWRNGNLFACIEPTESGYRLRLGTRKSNALPTTWMGIGWLIFGLILLVVLGLQGELIEEIFVPILFALLGVGMLTYNAIRLPRWSLEREEQMEYFAARAQAMLASSPTIPGSEYP